MNHVTPEDIWRAFRGGGGGTYGIVTSVKYQLFDQKTFHVILGGFGFPAGLITGDEEADAKRAAIKSKVETDTSGELAGDISKLYTMFLVDLLFNPANIGITSDFSNHCGSPELSFQANAMGTLFCWTEEDAFGVILAAWHLTVDASDIASEDEELGRLLKDYTFISLPTTYKSYSDLAKSNMPPNHDEVFPPNVVPDSPLPGFYAGKAYNNFCSFNLPLGLLQSDVEEDRDLVYKTLSSGTAGHVTGGLVQITGDGMDSVSPSERVSGQSSLSIEAAIYTHDILSDLLNSVYKHTDADGFPGYYEYNHICPDAKTPSRSDWTKECDPATDGDCFIIQEAVWGEELYSTLQGIKAAIDPKNLLDVYPGVKPLSADDPTVSAKKFRGRINTDSAIEIS